MSAATEHPTAPAGWYPDPIDGHLLRWWTGETWTERLEHRRPEIQIAPGAVDAKPISLLVTVD